MADTTSTSVVGKPRRSVIRLPRPLWICLAAIAILFVSAAVRIGAPIYQHSAAIREIKRCGGKWRQENRAPEWVRERVDPNWSTLFDDVVVVNLNGTPANDATLARLSWLSNLEELRLDDTQVTDAGLAHLSGLSNVKVLWLDNRQLTDAGVQHLRRLTSLRELSLTNTRVTDSGLCDLSEMTDLRWLFLNNTNVSNRGMIHFEGLRSLEGVWLDKTHVTTAGAARLKRALPKLKMVSIGK